jgi:methyl-accepting chemotaxis protein
MSGLISSISIRAKLITAFTLLLAGTIGLGLLAVERLDGVNAIAADLRDNWLPAKMSRQTCSALHSANTNRRSI